ncbi:hypothetical protein [Arthrobacter sp. FW306-2-2C-D06B]|uniref:hypothetical protein n=1 Tax=Arthrobacter sp. FW306-2-2C-D06B TaxID=2879618 RepID=UPI001F2A69AE|nr:hypothetical protein [Arthrobacter sp. FW306-2-2C-D06B]UKA59171.1 hypothetical protein LFT47_02105 [Arthrobacter sp. FW306-2-2C-D06B]
MDVPAGLGERGLSIWEAMATQDVPRNALVLEAARLADRLDELDNIIQGKGVLNLMQFRLDMESGEDGEYNVEVKFQNVFSEARQQAIAFSTILSKLAPADAAAKPANVPMPTNVTPLDRIKARGLKKA